MQLNDALEWNLVLNGISQQKWLLIFSKQMKLSYVAQIPKMDLDRSFMPFRQQKTRRSFHADVLLSSSLRLDTHNGFILMCVISGLICTSKIWV